MNLYNCTLDEHGFEILPGIFKEEELVKYRDLTDRIASYGDSGLEDPFSKYYMRHRSDQGVLYDLFQRHPEFRHMAESKPILDRIAQIVGDDIFLYENSLVYKPKGRDNEVPWHQDFINRPTEPIKYIAWIAFDNVTVENGAMKGIPGSHKKGFLPFYRVPGQTHHTRLDTSSIDVDSFVFLEMKAGDVLIFNQLLVHGSDRVSSVKPRRAYRVSYQSFEQVFTPRATPIVLRGGTPESVAKKYPARYEPPAEPAPEPHINPVRKFIRRVGKKLSKI